jgi:hypothetical protein
VNVANLLTDSYERRARLYPALLLIAPVVVTLVAILPGKWSALQSVVAAIAGFGGAFLLAQLARDAGKNREQQLFAKWGGSPSIAIFRHRDPRLDPITKVRYHKALSSLVKGANAPSPEEEESNSVAADQVYAAWSKYLRANTRDTKKYGLLFEENVSYGYRRNVWGLRPVGIIVGTLCCLVAAGRIYQQQRTAGNIDEDTAAAVIVGLLFLALWIFRFSSNWVRIPAEAYADRLAETVDSFGKK